MSRSYKIIEVDRQLAKNLEQLGTKRKFWFSHKNSDDGWLFKAEERKTGEDWAEKIACEICELLGLPHVHYELAIEKPSNTPGIVCRNIAIGPSTLVLGNQLLFERDARYPTADEHKYGIREHTVDAVAEAVRKLQMPPAVYCPRLPHGVATSLDVFVGYVMLDALIANQDRHHQNWGALRETNSMLAPTFDHGAALARNEPEGKRARRLHGPDPNYSVANFARKARSSFYGSIADTRPMGTMEAFQKFAALSSIGAQAWLNRLSLLNPDDFKSIVSRVPPARMTDIAREFTLQILLTNQQRILNEADPR